MRLKTNQWLYTFLVWILFAAILGVISLNLATFVATAQPEAEVSTVVWLKGPNDPVHVSTEITVTISISDVTGLYGGEFAVGFDAADLQAVDAQITPGECPAPDFEVVNDVDNATGTIDYVVTQLNPTPPISGDCEVAHIRFQTQQITSTVISFTNVLIADIKGIPIPATTLSLTLDILPPPPNADFSGSPTSGGPPLTVDFTNLSSGEYDTCAWDFGDGGTSAICDNPSHEYTTVGVYPVSLTVSGPGGSDTEKKKDYITIDDKYYNYLPLVVRSN